MSKPTFKVYKLACEYRFVPKLLFYDHVHKLGDLLFRDYKHWSRDANTVVLSDFTKRAALSLEHNRVVVQIDVPEATDALTTRFSRAWKAYYDAIKPEVFRRLGLRIQGIAPTEMKFEELVRVTHPRLFNSEPALGKIVGTNSKDYQYHVITTLPDNFTMQIVCGAITQKEGEKLFKPVSLVLDEGDQPFDITYPQVGYWIDCDLFQESPSHDAHKTFLDSAMKKVNSVTTELSTYLLGS